MTKFLEYLSCVIDPELNNRAKIRSTKQIIVEIICHCVKSNV